ncbi:MAG: hypothetical protein R2815_14035 [Flavobacteriales bacterium]
MTLHPLTRAHIEGPIWDSTDEFEALYPALLWHLHTPYALGLCAVRHGDVAGLGTATRHGEVGRITHIKVVTGQEETALRALLVNALVDELHAAGCTAISVTLPVAEVAQWEALGFRAHATLLRYAGGRWLQAAREEVIPIEPQHRMAVLRMDQRVFGLDRSTMLLEHEYLGLVYAEGIAVRGYNIPLLGEGVIVADSAYAGLELQRWHFPTQRSILLPEGNAAAHAHLTERGYTATPEQVRMVRGTARPLRVEWVYGWG